MYPQALAAAIALPVLETDRDARKKAVEKELKLLEGTWDVVALGEPEKDDDPKVIGLRYIFSGGTFKFEHGGERMGGGTIRVDPSRSPKTLDLTLRDRSTFLAIYDLRGDELRWCMGYFGIDRPTRFSAKDKWSYGRLRRVK